MLRYLKSLFVKRVVKRELPFRCSIHGSVDVGGRVPSNVCVDSYGVSRPSDIKFRCACSCTSYYDFGGRVLCASCGTSHVATTGGYVPEFIPSEEGYELGV